MATEILPVADSPAAAPTEETPEEHQADLEKKGKKEWAKLKVAVAADARFHHKHKHKIIGGAFLTVIVVVAIILAITLAVAAAVYFKHKADAAARAKEAASASAAVKIGKMSVVPPKDDDDDDASRRRFLSSTTTFQTISDILEQATNPKVNKNSNHARVRGLQSHSSADIDVSKFAVDSAYNTMTKSRYVEDGLSSHLRVTNMILCMLAQCNADEFMDASAGPDQVKSPFVAMVDENRCQGGQGGSSAPRKNPWTVVTRAPYKKGCDKDENGKETDCRYIPSETGKYEVSAWLEIGPEEPLNFKLEVEKSKIVIKNDGTSKLNDVKIQFAEESENGVKGFMKYTVDEGVGNLDFFMNSGDFSDAIRVEFSVDEGDSTEFEGSNVMETYGWAKVKAMQGDDVQEKTVTWNNDNLNMNGDMCVDRAAFVPVGDAYSLFNEEGKKMNADANKDFNFNLEEDITIPDWTDPHFGPQKGATFKKGTTFRGQANSWGLWIHPDDHDQDYDHTVLQKLSEIIFQEDGKKVSVEDPATGSVSEYKVHTFNGMLEGTKEHSVELSKFAGLQLVAAYDLDCPENAAKDSIEVLVRTKVVDGGSNSFKLQLLAQRNSTECDGGSPGEWQKEATPSDFLIPDDGLKLFSPVIEGVGRLAKGSQTVKGERRVRFHAKKDGKTMKLKCFYGCIDGSDPNTDFTISNAPKRSDAETYTYDGATGILTDKNNKPITNVNGHKHMILVPDTAATWKAMECGDSEDAVCSWWNAWSAPERYTWQTGASWCRSVSLTSSDGSSTWAPTADIKLAIKLPAEYKDRSLSGTKYKSKAIRAEFSGGWLSGLPQSCQHPGTFEIVDAETVIGWDSMRQECPHSYWSIPDMLVPDGVTGTEINWDGSETKYVLKASAVRQVLRRAEDASACEGVKAAPANAAVPVKGDLTEIKKLLEEKPIDAVVKVDAGVTKSEFAQD